MNTLFDYCIKKIFDALEFLCKNWKISIPMYLLVLYYFWYRILGNDAYWVSFATVLTAIALPATFVFTVVSITFWSWEQDPYF